MLLMYGREIVFRIDGTMHISKDGIEETIDIPPQQYSAKIVLTAGFDLSIEDIKSISLCELGRYVWEHSGHGVCMRSTPLSCTSWSFQVVPVYIIFPEKKQRGLETVHAVLLFDLKRSHHRIQSTQIGVKALAGCPLSMSTVSDR